MVSVPTSDEVYLDINTSLGYSPFTTSTNPQQPQIIAIGDLNSGQTNVSGRIQNITYVPGSFINISPAPDT